MSKQLNSIDTATDTFYSWVVKTNAIVQFCNTEVVTANNSANGATTTGKGYVIGTFGANTLVATNLSGGNTVSNTVLTITSNAVFTDSVVKVNPGLTLGANSIVHEHGVRFTTAAATANQVSDSFAVATYRSAKYVISVTDVTNSDYQVTEILLLHNGSNTFTTEYATLLSNTSLATFSSDISAGNARLLMSPAVTANLQVNIARTLVSI
jgi:hypothetical protein